MIGEGIGKDGVSLQVKYDVNRCPFVIGELVKVNGVNYYVKTIEILDKDGARYAYLIGLKPGSSVFMGVR